MRDTIITGDSMEKIQVKIAEYEGHIQGYELMYPPTEQYIWEQIMLNIPKNKRYLKHFINRGFTVNSDLDCHKVGGLEIPRGLLEYFAVIYIEDKI